MTDFYELMPRTGDIPPGADFLITITDDCMLPYIRPGEQVAVSCRETLCEMDAGIFVYKGRLVCRQWCEDITGTLHLLCANPKREDESISVPAMMREDCICLGKVLLSKKPEAPVYD